LVFEKTKLINPSKLTLERIKPETSRKSTLPGLKRAMLLPNMKSTLT